MFILLKYTLKSMLEKKIRSFLIILAVGLAGALYLASTELSNSIELMYEEKNKQQLGNIDLRITPNENSPSLYINAKLANNVEKVEEIISVSTAIGQYKIGSQLYDTFNLQGFELEKYRSINQLKLKAAENLEPFAGSKIILSQKTAKKYNFQIGEQLNLKIQGVNRQLTLVGIAEPKGIFANETEGIIGMMPFDTLSHYIGGEKQASCVYITIESSADIDKVQSDLKEIYAKYDVEKAFDEEVFKQNMSWITQPFLMMTLVVVFMSVFIIYSSFKVVMLEKLPAVGTFRSIGADKKRMNGVLLLESGIYGIVGGVMACCLGTGILYILAAVMSSSLGMRGAVQITLKPSSLITTFALSNTVAFASTIIPILSVSKIALKDIILNNRPYKGKKMVSGAVIGGICTAGGMCIASLQYGSLGMLCALIGTIISSVGIVKLVPVLTYQIAVLLSKIFGLFFGGVGSLAGKNLKKNKSILNSITLVTLGITYLLMIATVTSNISDQLIGFYKDTFNCEVRARLTSVSKYDLRSIKANENVKAAMATLAKNDVEVKQIGARRINVEGIDKGEALEDYLKFNIKGDSKVVLEELQKGRNIIINEIIARKHNFKIGDTLDIDLGDKIGSYKIIGFMDTMWNNSDFALLPIKYLRRDMNQTGYSTVYIKVKENGSENELTKWVKKQFGDKVDHVATVKEMMRSDAETTAGLLNLITAFAGLAMFIEIVGVVNNLIIGFIERKQGLAVLRSIGMSKKQVLGMIFIEGLGTGIIGALGGSLGGICMIKMVGYVLYAMQMPFDIFIIPQIFPVYIAGGILVTLIGSILPARSSFKLNIIEAIKYE